MLLKLQEMIERVSPLLIKPHSSAITISLSKRFFLFELMRKTVAVIEDDPYLNFISLLKNYKILGKFLYGTVREMHRDRNKLYFRKFFMEPELYKLIKEDLEWLVKDHPDMKMTVTKRGVIIYDNYKKNQFNTLLLTVHSGTWTPRNIRKKMALSQEQRFSEEDIDTHILYSRLVLEKGGIWIDNKQSRFAVDFNRPLSKAIYTDRSEVWVDMVWRQNLSHAEKEELIQGHREFYFTLARIVDSYRFNIIFDGHTMSDAPDRPKISFGTNFIPKFYIPIVKSMRQRLAKVGYSPVAFNKPYKGGYILEWLRNKAPDLFICSMEINKALYMNKARSKVIKKRRDQLSKDVCEIFNLEVEEDTTSSELEPADRIS